MGTPPLPDDDIITAVEAFRRLGSQVAAAKELGIARESLQRRLRQAQERGLDRPGIVVDQMAKVRASPAQARHGWIVTPTEDGGRTSTFWKAPPVSPDDMAEMVRNAIAHAIEPIAPTPAPEHVADDYLAMLGLPDWHMLMQAWGRETGQDYDINIARNNLVEGSRRLFARCRPADTCVLLGVGDQFHVKDDDARVGRGKHEATVDGRLLKGFEITVWGMISVIRMALERFMVVKVRLLPGNHDEWMAGVLAVSLSVAFHDEPRVSVDLDPSYFWRIKFGRVLLAATHGDNLRNPRDMAMLLSHKFRAEFGETDHHFMFTADKHHEKQQDLPGWHWTQLRAMTAADAYSARSFLTPAEISLRYFHRLRGRQDVIYEPLPLMDTAA